MSVSPAEELPSDSANTGGGEHDTSLDELAELFQLDAVTFDAQAQQQDKQEADKSGSTRWQEIETRLIDESAQETLEGREIAQKLYVLLSQEGDHTHEVAQILGDGDDAMAAVVQNATNGGFTGTLESISRYSDRYEENGSHDIFKAIPPGKYVFGEGERRKQDQTKFTRAQGIVLGLAEQALDSGNIPAAIVAMDHSRVKSVFTYKPSWLTRKLAATVSKANLQDRGTRQEILKLQDVGFGVIVDDLPDMKKKPPEEKTERDHILLVVGEAKQLENLQIEADRLAEQKAKYERELRESMERHFDQAAQEGEEDFSTNRTLDRGYSVRLSQNNLQYRVIESCMRDREFTEMTKVSQPGGPEGYLNLLGRIVQEPAIIERMVDIYSEKMYSDVGGRSKNDYEQANEMEKFRDHVRSLAMTEIYGRAFGFMRGLICFDNNTVDRGQMGLNSEQRAAYVTTCMEIMGQGVFLQGVMLGKVPITPDQTRIRSRMVDFRKDPLTMEQRRIRDGNRNDRSNEHFRALAAQHSEFLTGMAPLMMTADVNVLEHKRLVMEEKVNAERKKETKRQELRNSVAEMRTNLSSVRDSLEELHDDEVLVYEVDDYERMDENEVIPRFITISTLDMSPDDMKAQKNAKPTIAISVIAGKTDSLTKNIQAKEAELHEATGNTRALREEIARLKLEHELTVALGSRLALTQLNNPQFAKFKEFGVALKLTKGRRAQIHHEAFKNIPDQNPPTSSAVSSEIKQSLASITEPVSEYQQKTKKPTLAELRQRLDELEGKEDILTVERELSVLHGDIFARKAEATQAAKSVKDKLSQQVTALASRILKRKLQNYLESQQRVYF